MKYSCLVIDDEPLSREMLSTYIAEIKQLELVGTYSSAIEASEVMKERSIDLIFLDIEMPLLKGTDFFRHLTEKPNVIFTTAYREYAVEGFELNATDYLLKPLVFDRFFKAVEKFLNQKNERTETSDSHIFIPSNKKQVKLVLDDIYYVESVKDYVKVVQKKGESSFKIGISNFEIFLDKQFLRVHRSFIVNQNHISAFSKKSIEIKSFIIPIGDYYRDEVLNKIK